MKPWGIHWFRRDLRSEDNEALSRNSAVCGGRTLGIFCFDSKFLARKDFSFNRFQFFLQTLTELKKDLRRNGGDLLIVDEPPDDFFAKLFTLLEKHRLPAPFVTWCRDYEPFARKRDAGIESRLQKHGVQYENCRDHLLFEPWEVTKPDGSFYKVYSPFAKSWFEKLNRPEGQARISFSSRPKFQMKWSELSDKKDFPFADAKEDFLRENRKHVTVPVPKAGASAALRKLEDFQARLYAYKKLRDFPAANGTSLLSIFLKNGSLTTAQIIKKLNLGKTRFESPQAAFVKELAWREFYYSILYHRPEVENQSFLDSYRDLPWENRRAWFSRWQEGTTGFPIVDAGMRQLQTTGWMHNRVRMIVASFLTKDLLIDWRWGERHFMKLLLDGDLAPNNGGWQWAASTGCDPQPYFRVFNPWLQGKKFDPDGTFIKKFVPELREAPTKALHDPEVDRRTWKYPAPIVDHGVQRLKAIRLFKK